MSTPSNIVQFDNVGLQYTPKVDVFHNVSFTLEKGSFHFLTGASGAGKSSLIRLMYLGYRRYTGTIKIFGQDAADITHKQLPAFRQNIGVVFQDYYLLDHMTVIENVALPLRVRGMGSRQSRKHAAEFLAWVGLEKNLNDYPNTLSGGEQQRVALARAVIGKPKLLLADEPTGSVDDKMAVKIMYLFEELNRLGTTIVLATHNRDLAGEFPHPELYIENKTLHVKPAPTITEATSLEISESRVINYA